MSLRGSACSRPPPRTPRRPCGPPRRAYGVSVRGLCGPPPLKGACGRFAVSLRRSVRGLGGRPPPAGGSMASVGSAAPLRTSAGPTAVPRGLCGRHGSALTVVPASSGRSAASRRRYGCPRGPRSRPSTSLHPYIRTEARRAHGCWAWPLRAVRVLRRPTAFYGDGVLRRPTGAAGGSRRLCGGHRPSACGPRSRVRPCGGPQGPATVPAPRGRRRPYRSPRAPYRSPGAHTEPVRGTHPATGARGSSGLRCTPAAPRPRPAVR